MVQAQPPEPPVSLTMALAIVRYGTGVGKHMNQLAFVTESDDGMVHYAFNGRVYTGARAEFHKSSMLLSTASLRTSHLVLEVVKRDIEGVASQVRDEEFTDLFNEYRRALTEECARVRSPEQRRKNINAVVPVQEQNATAYANTDISEFIEQYKRSAGAKKLVCRALQTLPCRNLQVIGFTQKIMPHVGHVLSLSDEDNQEEINTLLAKKNLAPLTDFQVRTSVAYGQYDANGALSTVIVTTTAFINTHVSTCVHIDWAASLTKNEAYTMVETIKRQVLRRRHKSYVITQCLNKDSAKSFWKGRLTKTSWARVFVGLIHIYDNDFMIYNDAEPMGN